MIGEIKKKRMQRTATARPTGAGKMMKSKTLLTDTSNTAEYALQKRKRTPANAGQSMVRQSSVGRPKSGGQAMLKAATPMKKMAKTRKKIEK